MEKGHALSLAGEAKTPTAEHGAKTDSQKIVLPHN